MNPVTVSVIIPAYNCAAFLPATIESLKVQSYQDFEVILVDDGSTDGTVELARDLAAAWPKMRVIHIEHAGLARARNVAIEQMNGQWIALLDADDLWKADKLEKCMEYLAATPRLSMVYHPMIPISTEGKPLKIRGRRCRQGWLTEHLFHRLIIRDPSAVFHKRIIEACGPFNQSLPVCVGREFWLRVSTKFEIGLVNEPLGLRRCHESSLNRRNLARSNRVKVEILENFYFEQGGKDLLKHRRRAMRRLAKTRYATARVFLAEKQYQDAAEYFAKAIRFCPTLVKSYPFYAAAKLICLAKKNGSKLID